MELLKTTCSGGALILTESSVIIRLGGIKEDIIPRAGLSVGSAVGAFTIYGGTRVLTFTSGGRSWRVRNVPKKAAKTLLELLR